MIVKIFNRSSPRKKLRAATLLVLSSIFLTYRLLYDVQAPSCLIDELHIQTASMNHNLDFNNNDNIVIGIGQVIMDSWIILSCLFWLFKTKNTRFGVCVVVYFVPRYFHIFIMKFPFPQHIVWHNPGFISLTVPYERTRDFYFSGHTGTLSAIMLQFYALNAKIPFLIVFLCLLYTMSMLIITRVHYTIDVIGGLCFVFFSFRIGKLLTFYVDYLISIPFLLGQKIKQKVLKKEDSEPLLNKNQILY